MLSQDYDKDFLKYGIQKQGSWETYAVANVAVTAWLLDSQTEGLTAG